MKKYPRVEQREIYNIVIETLVRENGLTQENVETMLKNWSESLQSSRHPHAVATKIAVDLCLDEQKVLPLVAGLD